MFIARHIPRTFKVPGTYSYRRPNLREVNAALRSQTWNS